MTKITLTEDQMKIVRQAAPSRVQVCDPQGIVLGTVDSELTPEFIAELKRRAASPGPWFTGAQIQARLQALQTEWDRTGGFDEAYMRDFLRKLDQTDPGHMRPKGQGQ